VGLYVYSTQPGGQFLLAQASMPYPYPYRQGRGRFLCYSDRRGAYGLTLYIHLYFTIIGSISYLSIRTHYGLRRSYFWA